MTCHVLGVFAVVALAGSASAQYSETFDDPFGDWTSRWLYQNSTTANYYVSAGNCDETYRGNNPQGLWVSDLQQCGGGVGGPTCTLDFDPAFGQTLRSLSFGVECFVQCDIKIWDLQGNVVGELLGVAGGGFDFDHKDVVSGLSNHGIGKVTFDSSPYGGGQIEGNTSVDNFFAETVPAPGAAGLLGVAGLLAGRRRR